MFSRYIFFQEREKIVEEESELRELKTKNRQQNITNYDPSPPLAQFCLQFVPSSLSYIKSHEYYTTTYKYSSSLLLSSTRIRNDFTVGTCANAQAHRAKLFN